MKSDNKETLFSISEDMLILMRTIEEEGGDISDEIAEQLEITNENLSEKLHAYYSLYKLKMAEAEVVKKEAQRLTKKAKSIENLAERLKDRTAMAVQLFGTKNPKTGNMMIKYDDLTLTASPKIDIIYDDANEAKDIERIMDKIQIFANTISLEPADAELNSIEMGILWDELTEREKLIINSTSTKIHDKFSFKQMVLIQKVLNDNYIAFDIDIDINRTTIKNTLKDNDTNTVTDENDKDYKITLDKNKITVKFT